MDGFVVVMFLTLSVQGSFTVGMASSAVTQMSIMARKGDTVTLPCSLKWDLSKEENLSHVTWFLTNPDRPIASHECPNNDSLPCKTKTSKSNIHLDMDFHNKTANLIIEDVHTTDSGIYVCLVAAKQGLIQQSINLSVSGTDTSIRIESSGGIFPEDPSKIMVTADTEETLLCSTYLKSGLNGTLFWKSDGLNLTESVQSRLSIDDGEDYITSSVTFYPTYADSDKWVECGNQDNVKSPRRVSLKVLDKVEKASPDLPTNNGTTSLVCFHLGILGHSTENKTCCQADNIVFLPNIPSNGHIGISCCTSHECRDINFRIGGDKSSGDNLATIMTITLYFVIGSGIVIIAVVFSWRKRKAFKCRHDEEHIYCEPPAVTTRITSLPPPPLSWIENEEKDGSFMTSFDDSFARDDELQELSTTYSDLAPGAHRSLSRTISTLSRRSLRDSEVVYVNVPIRSVLARIKKVGWSYF